MDYSILVKNLFNDMFVFFNGTQPMGLEILLDVYQEEPLFLAFISNLDDAVKVPYNDVMKEFYGFYKRFCNREMTDDDWDEVVAGIQGFYKKWQNKWCRKLILAIMEIIEREQKEYKASETDQEQVSEYEEHKEEEPQEMLAA